MLCIHTGKNWYTGSRNNVKRRLLSNHLVSSSQAQDAMVKAYNQGSVERYLLDLVLAKHRKEQLTRNIPCVVCGKAVPCISKSDSDYLYSLVCKKGITTEFIESFITKTTILYRKYIDKNWKCKQPENLLTFGRGRAYCGLAKTKFGMNSLTMKAVAVDKKTVPKLPRLRTERKTILQST